MQRRHLGGGCCFFPHLNQTSERQSYIRLFEDLCMRFTQQTKNKTKKLIPPCGSTERLPCGTREWPVVKGRVARRRAHSQSRASEQSRSTEPSAAPRGPASARRQAPPPRTFGHHATTRARPHPSKELLEVPKTTKLPVANSIRCLLGRAIDH